MGTRYKCCQASSSEPGLKGEEVSAVVVPAPLPSHSTSHFVAVAVAVASEVSAFSTVLSQSSVAIFKFEEVFKHRVRVPSPSSCLRLSRPWSSGLFSSFVLSWL
ncbi:hypothetical protein PIB30_088020 [Stylosanthes scabra]|uniref:Uncharacterized protein n=1 Tax=Stylosanthes scabra TaxID=79078 RepID=A0ABU6RTR4_9FABA|nr:hypothetical protein [Stylosanthes scabra]